MPGDRQEDPNAGFELNEYHNDWDQSNNSGDYSHVGASNRVADGNCRG